MLVKMHTSMHFKFVMSANKTEICGGEHGWFF